MTAVAKPVAVSASRVRRFGALYVVEHKVREVRAFFWSMVVTLIGTPFLYLFAFGVGLAALVTRNEGFEELTGVGYLQFVAPALVVNAAVLVAVEEFMFGVLQGFMWNKSFFAMSATPLTGRQIVDGMMLYVGLRALVTAGIYFAVVAGFGGAVSPAAVAVVPIAVLVAWAFSPIAAYSASIREDRSQFNMVLRVIVFPLTLFSGTVFPLSQLPVFLQWIGWISPIWHGSELARQFSYGAVTGFEPLWLSIGHVVFLVVLAAFGWFLTARVATRRLDQ